MSSVTPVIVSPPTDHSEFEGLVKALQDGQLEKLFFALRDENIKKDREIAQLHARIDNLYGAANIQNTGGIGN